MQGIARSQTKKFAVTAASIGGADVSGVSDIAVLSPLQVFLVVLIGSFSCEELSVDTAIDYFSELGVVGGAGLLGRKLAGTIAGMFPGAGQAINAGVAGASTYAIGRSAEEYYFNDNFKRPQEFINEARTIVGDQF
jgi:uncharacterized protein (DUF697 family)